MTARQAGNHSCYLISLKNAQVVTCYYGDRESDTMSCVKTLVFELAMLVRTMAKGVAGVPSMISIKDMSIGYAMYVMSIMADTKVSKASLD
jgi:hypothetical protein